MSLSFDAAIAAFAPSLPVAIALSGGADSTALLVACARRWPGEVHAIHVHHGLQAAADEFEQHCTRLCERVGVPLHVCRVDARHAPGQSPEDAARTLRYRALAEVAVQAGTRSVALAQHAEDQVETILLALSRGAGVSGLAGMRPHWVQAGVSYHRPLLNVPAAQLREWLRERGIAWIEDPSNADERFTRNRIRSRVLPALERALPAYRDTFARSARHAAQAQELLQALALQDLGQTGVPPRIAALRELSGARQANVLRYWLRESHGSTPSAAQMDELLAQIADCATRGHRIHLKAGRGFITRQGALLHFGCD